MRSQSEYREALSDRLDEAVEYFDKFATGSESLSFAQQQTLELRRLFNERKLDELRKTVAGFEGIDDCRYGSVFAQTVKLLSDYLETAATS